MFSTFGVTYRIVKDNIHKLIFSLTTATLFDTGRLATSQVTEPI
jgi:hypothetical protein